MSDTGFRLMAPVMAVGDALFPSVERRVKGFGIGPGVTVVDYGCGPGRYTVPTARRVGPRGMVYAVDVQELALDGRGREPRPPAVRSRMRRMHTRRLPVPALLAAFVLLLAVPSGHPQNTNPFTSQGVAGGGLGAARFAPVPVLSDLQRSLNASLAGALRAVFSGFSLSAALPLLAVALAYGFVHALSPGHGKTLLGVWVLAERRSLARVARVSYTGALLHVGSAIALSLITWLVVSRTSAGTPAGVEKILRFVSAGLLAITGIRDLVVAVRRRGSGVAEAHHHVSAIPMGIGAVPCPISTLVMAFALGAAAPAAGVITCLLFGAGLGTALYSIAVAAWLLRRRFDSLLASRARFVVTLVLPLAGAVILILFAVLTLPI